MVEGSIPAARAVWRPSRWQDEIGSFWFHPYIYRMNDPGELERGVI